MTEANPIILDQNELQQEELPKDSSEQANSLEDRTRNECLATFTEPIPAQQKRLRNKNWFLTFPQTTTTKEEASTQLQNHLKLNQLGIKGFLIAQEKHKDNHTHLHIALWLNKTLKTSDKKFFDFVCK